MAAILTSGYVQLLKCSKNTPVCLAFRRLLRTLGVALNNGPSTDASCRVPASKLTSSICPANMSQISEKMKVLFCSHHFTDGFRFTQEFLADESAIEVVRCESDRLDDNVDDASVLVPQMTRIGRETIARAKKLRMILQFGVGLEGVDTEPATEAGVIVARIPGAASGNAPSCAEMAIYLILALLRNQRGMEEAVAASRLGTPTGRTLQGLTVLIVGFGAIGKELAVRLKPFGVRLLALRVSGGRPPRSDSANGTSTEPSSSNLMDTPGTETATTPERPNSNGMDEMDGTKATECADVRQSTGTGRTDGTEGADGTGPTERTNASEALLDDQGGLDRRDELLVQADVIVLACLLTRETRGLVNEDFLRKMKQDAILVNIARGHLLDYDAVRAALEADRLAGLGMDVAWSEPFDPSDFVARHRNVILTPHVAGVSDRSYRTMAEIIAHSVRQLRDGQPFTKIEVVNHVSKGR